MKKLLMLFMASLLACVMWAQVPPSELSTHNAGSVTCKSFTSGSVAFLPGTLPLKQKGVVYGTSPNPTMNGTKVYQANPDASAFTMTVTGLSPSTLYYYRSYAYNLTGGAGYGPQKSITTPAASGATGLNANNGWPVYCNGFRIAQAAFNVGCPDGTDAGGCWSSTNSSPTPENSSHFHATAPQGQSFLYEVTGLTANTKYYYRTWSTNSAGRVYSPVRNVTTCATCAGVCYP